MPVPQELTRRSPSAMQAETERPMLPVAPNHEFHKVFFPDHPSAWMPVEIVAGEGVPDDDVGFWWLPVLGTRSTMPGLKGNRTIKRGQERKHRWAGAHQRIVEDGGIVIPQTMGYMQPFPCRHPRTGEEGTHYAETWEEPLPVVRNRKLTFRFDRQRYYRWLLWLCRETDLIPPMPEEFVAEHQGRLAQRVARRSMIDFGGDDEKKAKHVAEAEAQVNRATKALPPEKARPGARPAPTRRKGATPPAGG